ADAGGLLRRSRDDLVIALDDVDLLADATEPDQPPVTCVVEHRSFDRVAERWAATDHRGQSEIAVELRRRNLDQHRAVLARPRRQQAIGALRALGRLVPAL